MGKKDILTCYQKDIIGLVILGILFILQVVVLGMFMDANITRK